MPGRNAMKTVVASVQDTLGYDFRDLGLLQTALTHPSYSVEQAQPIEDNQRLEFLGDAVLQLVMTDVLFHRFVSLREGELTKIRSALTKESSLARFAQGLGLGAGLRLGKGEARAGGAQRASNLADAFEAVLGAIYLDGGFEPARALCAQLAAAPLADHDRLLAGENPKGALQELVHVRAQTVPVYEVTAVSGPEHLPEFSVRVVVDGEEVATATAGSRKAAEQQAARLALRELQRDEDAS